MIPEEIGVVYYFQYNFNPICRLIYFNSIERRKKSISIRQIHWIILFASVILFEILKFDKIVKKRTKQPNLYYWFVYQLVVSYSCKLKGLGHFNEWMNGIIFLNDHWVLIAFIKIKQVRCNRLLPDENILPTFSQTIYK